ncbi:uncharacterized protein BO97DRAFT_22474 [Aspergillus homomorphus CBS 101889]|uniref:Uncharacterized protein n=1 Tax=Aspergillus homomorphus (strain CBS 101889) TaxID=1450537 RepID=A0A395HGJ4_ASPHC|nr:hypothetical protein BO97DRAFT_22474 [Aspergillus homomorphus CBS 101889]RAL06629.1 hypothetical protein BO97DRAFT_22474 [Aspergillus homomorphus CBS 101889]
MGTELSYGLGGRVPCSRVSSGLVVCKGCSAGIVIVFGLEVIPRCSDIKKIVYTQNMGCIPRAATMMLSE